MSVPAGSPLRVERLAVPVALAGFALTFEAIGGGALLLAAQYFLSFHHALMQNYGLLRASQRRSARSVDPRLDMAACLLLPGAALLYRAGMVCDRYAGAALPSVPMPLVQAMAAAGVVALAAFARREWQSYRSGERVDPIAAGLLFGTNLMWSIMLVGNPHPAMPLYALASGHYAQYLYFVRRVEARDPADRSREPGSSPPVGASLDARALSGGAVGSGWGRDVSPHRSCPRVCGPAAASMALRPAAALDLPPWAAAMIGVNSRHYWLDHRIWRSPRRAAATTTVAVA